MRVWEVVYNIAVMKFPKLPGWVWSAVLWAVVAISLISWIFSLFQAEYGEWIFAIIFLWAVVFLRLLMLRFFPKWEEWEYRNIAEVFFGIGFVGLFIFILTLL